MLSEGDITCKLPAGNRVARNGIKCEEVNTIKLSSPSGGEQLAFLNFINFTAVQKSAPKLRKLILNEHFWVTQGLSASPNLRICTQDRCFPTHFPIVAP